MSISIRRYVDITSGVGGGAAVAQRELIGRIFSDNPRTPANMVVEVTSAEDAANYYGAASEEAKRAAFYFAFTSKSITRPKKLSFSRWAKVTAPARIYGAKVGTTIAQFHAIVAGGLSLTVNGQIAVLAALDLSGAASFAAVAAAMQVAIRAQAGSEFAAALVAYDAVGGVFNFTATTAGAAAIAITDTPLSEALGWTPAQNAVLSPGVDVQTITAALDASVAASNNFGSFTFIEALAEGETVEAATWVAARNVEFMYLPRVTVANAAAISADIIGLSGSGMVLGTVAAEYDELLPMMVLASTDYERRGAVQNYMFQQTNLSPKVSSNADADTYDGLRVNYYGNTQTAGQQINFFQRGVLTGVATDPVDMNTFANEMWFKDAAAASIMSLLLALPRVPANAQGRSQVLAILQDPINRALLNGTISVAKPLTVAQQIFVGEITGDPLAWHQVQTLGYWVDAVVVEFTTSDDRTEFKIVYTLVYSKDDTVRKVEGTHALI